MKKRFVTVTTSHAGEGRNRVSVAAVPHVASPASYSHTPEIPLQFTLALIGAMLLLLVWLIFIVWVVAHG